ncbi:MAG: Fpg/Nei family DNA glycosylase [Actinomycetota bacterium]
MPELPDVESYRRFFSRHAAGRTVRRTVVPDPAILRNTDPQTLDRALKGRRFEEPERVGKWLLCWTDGPALLLHFGMTGFLVWSQDEPERHRHDRVILELDTGDELRYRNMRKLGGAWLAHDRAEAAEVLGPIGPDALAIRRGEFLERLSERRGGVKAALMDQSLIAGVGNLVADEVLWQARLHPRHQVAAVSEDDRRELYRTMHAVLKEAVDRYDFIPRKRGWLSYVRGKPGAMCPRCGTPLERITAAGRTTYFCPRCQPLPRGGPLPPRAASPAVARPTTRAAPRSRRRGR